LNRISNSSGDTLHVQELLRHRNILNILSYITIEKRLFQETTNDQYYIRVGKNTKNPSRLVEVGFKYVTDEYNDGSNIFESGSERLKLKARINRKRFLV